MKIKFLSIIAAAGLLTACGTTAEDNSKVGNMLNESKAAIEKVSADAIATATEATTNIVDSAKVVAEDKATDLMDAAKDKAADLVGGATKEVEAHTAH